MHLVAEKAKGAILVIDDDTLVRRMLCSSLHKMGYTTIEAPTGMSGLHEFKKSRPSLVITDLLMPDENGFETILKIRAESSDVKIIAMSSGGRNQDGDFLEVARELGAHAIIKKPFTLEDIEEALAIVLSGAAQ